MKYHSTRNSSHLVEPSEAVIMGLAEDGGLFVPDKLPKIDFSAWLTLNYQQIAKRIFRLFFSDLTEATIEQIVDASYGENFSDREIVPTHWVNRKLGFLELWHGPTLAFKDVALQFLPHLMQAAAEQVGLKAKILILTATSGDTGKAAMEGFSGVEGFQVIVFYPHGGVSSFQKRQMLCRRHDNVRAISLIGDFDTCQRGVKGLFADPEFNRQLASKGYVASSANSINIGRLVPQTIYYIYSYLRAVRTAQIRYGEPLHVIVPSGNFGNILAACYAKAMGLPLGDIRLAANSNHVLADFLQSGIYDANRSLVKTSSPSMDILVASNLERYLYLKNPDSAFINSLMQDLREQGRFVVAKELLDLKASWANEEATSEAISEVYEEYHYLIDPHTAVAYSDYLGAISDEPTIIAATASPYKFFAKILSSLGKQVPVDDIAAIKAISKLSGHVIPAAVSKLWQLKQTEEIVISPEKILKEVYYALNA